MAVDGRELGAGELTADFETLKIIKLIIADQMFQASNHDIFQAALQIWSAEAWLRFGGDGVGCRATSGAKQVRLMGRRFLLWFLG